MRFTLLALALGAALPVSSLAAPVELDPIVVTPARGETPLSDAMASTSVLTRADLDRLQTQSLIEALAGLPGVGISRNGGEGHVSSVFLRGTESRHVAVFIDGVKLGSATTGTVALQDIPLAQVERIELVRGPLSGLYGSDAIGGVIQVFTRKGDGFGASLTLGSRDTQRYAVHGSLGDERVWLNLGASQDRTQGIDACNGVLAASLFKACFANEPDRDGYRNRAFNLSAGARLGDATRIEARALRAEGRLDYDGGFVNQSETVQQTLGASVTHKVSARWTTKLTLAQSRDESKNFKDGAFMTRFDTRFDQQSWENTLALGATDSLTLGVDRYDESVEGTTNYVVDDRQTLGVFAQYRGEAAGFDYQANLRHDDNSQFGGHVTGGVALGHALGEGLRARVSYGEAFKAPTFNDLYFPDSPPFFFSNPDLKPESSRSWEAALDGRLAAGNWTAALFHTRIDNLILFSGTQPANNADARIVGLELGTRLLLAGWQINANLTLQDPENRSAGANRGNTLARRAEQMFNLDIDREVGAWQLGGSLRAQGKRFDNAANTDRMAGFAVVDLRAETRFAKQWLAQLKLENVLDKAYETAYLYNQPGRGVFLTLSYEAPK